jgi:hypothetical protein
MVDSPDVSKTGLLDFTDLSGSAQNCVVQHERQATPVTATNTRGRRAVDASRVPHNASKSEFNIGK